ncbi:hypothetical protein HMPREF9103_01717, partial [Lentilactobacillus parafarraginis F0439]
KTNFIAANTTDHAANEYRPKLKDLVPINFHKTTSFDEKTPTRIIR